MVVSLGWKYGFITGFLDVLKSASAVWIITYLYPNSNHLISLQYLAGCSAIMGHIFPFFMDFKGGKGMACFLGMLLGMNFIFGLKCMVALMLTTILTSYVALGSIIAYGALPIWGILSGSMAPNAVILTSLIGVIGIIKHRNNISNMIQGTEIGFWQVVFNKHKQDKMNYIFDFDSTLITVETLDELAYLSLQGDTQKEEKAMQISQITEQAMNGEIPFTDALDERLKILQADKTHLEMLCKQLKQKFSSSISRHTDFLTKNKDNIYVVSGGFTEVIVPIMVPMGIAEDHIFANHFTYNGNGKINGFDKNQFMAQKLGKVDAVRSLNLEGTVVVIGDGWTDYQIKEAGLADYFVAYTESVSRPTVIEKGDIIAASFDEVLDYLENIKK
jgi:acyl-phosphate glycerol 3-phosphate acyltransferase